MKQIRKKAPNFVAPIAALFLCLLSFQLSAKESLVVLPVQGDATDKELALLREAIISEFTRSGTYRVANAAEVDQSLETELERLCAIPQEGENLDIEQQCIQKALVDQNAELIVQSTLNKIDTGYAVTIKIINGFSKEVIAQKQRFCDECTTTRQRAAAFTDAVREFSGATTGATGIGFTTEIVDEGKIQVRRITPEVKGDQASNSSTVHLSVRPNDVRVLLNGADAGFANPEFKKAGLQPNQNITIDLIKNNFITQRLLFTLRPGVNDVGVIDLNSALGTFLIKSAPSGADVIIAGEKVGITPYSLQRVRGKVLVDLEKEFYVSQSHALEIKAGETIDQTFTLHNNSGNLIVKSTPSNALVVVTQGNIEKTATTPADIKLVPGNYFVQIKLGGYETLELQGTVAPNKATLLTNNTLRQLECQTLIKTEPPDSSATMRINGKNYGKPPLQISIPAGNTLVTAKSDSLSGKSEFLCIDGQLHEITVPLSPKRGEYLVYIEYGVAPGKEIDSFSDNELDISLNRNWIGAVLTGRYVWPNKRNDFFSWRAGVGKMSYNQTITSTEYDFGNYTTFMAGADYLFNIHHGIQANYYYLSGEQKAYNDFITFSPKSYSEIAYLAQHEINSIYFGMKAVYNTADDSGNFGVHAFVGYRFF